MRSLPLISVVDDDDAVRESLQALIRSAGFAVKGFASAEEFLHSEQLHQTGCLILDIRLPGMNGVELKRHLASNHNEIPIIFITAHGDKATRARALSDGALEYLFKPFSGEALLNAIQAAVMNNIERNAQAAE
jgi:FixJ family two-component response regulator